MKNISKNYIKEIYIYVLKHNRPIKIVDDEIVITQKAMYNYYEWALKDDGWECIGTTPIYDIYMARGRK